ncbi:ADP-ribosylation factor-related protein 1 [Hordeum vulgare]|nr:ADP-ribosylation factor-related protein 1 [Hordeum vulgare]
MRLWNYGHKGKHDREAGSSSGHRRGSVKEEVASPPRRASAPAPFAIGPRPAGQRDRQYLNAEVCRRYSEMRTPVPWSDVHLPNNWYLSADWVPIPPVPTSGRARRDEIERRRFLSTTYTTTTEDEMALSAAGDVAIPELMEEEEVMEDAPVAVFPPDLVGQQWSWSCTASEMVHEVGGVNWCPTPSRSPEQDASRTGGGSTRT